MSCWGSSKATGRDDSCLFCTFQVYQRGTKTPTSEHRVKWPLQDPKGRDLP